MKILVLTTNECVVNEEFSTFWHRRLGHISIERIKSLASDRVLDTLDFSNVETCIGCITGKQTNNTKKSANRCSKLLDSIYIDIYNANIDA